MNDGDYALLVGIKSYPFLEQGLQLEGPVKAAEQIGRTLMDACQVPPGNITIIRGQSPFPGNDGDLPTPVKDQIDDAFAALFNRTRNGKRRRLYIYFTGHGYAKHTDDVMLLMANATMSILDRVVDSELYEEKLSHPYSFFPEQVFIYDCCRNHDADIKGGDEPKWSKLTPPDSGAPVTQFTIYATEFMKVAREATVAGTERLPLLTQALIDGLNGKAAVERGPGKYVITAESLALYAVHRVGELTEGTQVPVTNGDTHKDLILVPNAVPPHLNVTVKRAETAAPCMVRVYNAQGNLATSQLMTGATISFWLMPGLYLFELGPGKEFTCTVPDTGTVEVPCEGGGDA